MKGSLAVRRAAVLVLAALATAAIALLCVVAWEQVRVDAFLFAKSGSNQVLAFSAIVLAVAALGLVIGPAGRRAMVVACAGVAAGMLVLTAALAGGLAALLIAAGILLCAWQIGEWLLSFAGRRGAGVLLAVGIGYAVLTTVVFLFGVVGALRWWCVTLPVLLVACIGLARLVQRAGRMDGGPRMVWRWMASGLSRFEAITGSLALLVLAATCIWTAAPEVQFDPLWGKEWLPSAWADAGTISVDPRDAQTFQAGGTLYVTTIGHLVGADAIGRYLSLLTGAVLAFAVWQLVRPRAGRSIAAVLALVFLCAPHVLWQMGTADDDLQLCLAAGALAVGVVAFSRGSWREALIVGVLVGGAVSGKFHLLAFAGIAALGWLIISGRRGRLPSVAGFALGAITIAAPSLIYRWVESGNPFFPGLNDLFESKWWPPVNETFNLPFGGPAAFSDLVKLPITVFTEPTRFMEAVPDGVFGLLPLVLVVFLVAGWASGSWAHRVVWLSTLVAVLAWWVQLRYLRYLLPYAFVATIFVAGPLASLRLAVPRWLAGSRTPVLAIGASFLVAAAAGTAAASFFNIAERVPVKAALGIESAGDYRARSMPGVGAIEAINRITPPGSRIVVDGMVVYQRALTEDARTLVPAWEMNGLINWLRDSGQSRFGPTDPRAWHELGIGWAALGVGPFEALGAMGPLGQVIKRSGRPMWTDGRTALYRLPVR
jgi:hypothetical protein